MDDRFLNALRENADQIDGRKGRKSLGRAEGEMMGEGDQEGAGPEASEGGVYKDLARPAARGISDRAMPVSPAPVSVCLRS